MNVLFATHSPPHYIAPPRISTNQIIVGHNQTDIVDQGRVKSLKTEMGEFDLVALVKRLPLTQKPDVIFVRSDSLAQCRPIHIANVGCPVILVVGDTHHDSSPIHGLIDYAKSQPFAATVLDYTRQHAHFFVEAGVPNVFWLPGLNIHRIPISASRREKLSFTFVGQVGEFHPRRLSMCRALKSANLDLLVRENIFGQDARDIHAASQLNFNCSLNSDLNMRIFEVLQSGGALLTDRLAPEAGLDDLFQDGRDLVLYDEAQDCIDRARELLSDADVCHKIAIAGKKRYEEILAPEKMVSDLLALIQHGTERPELSVKLDRRTRLIESMGFTKKLRERINTYQILQENHRLRNSLAVVASPNIQPEMLADLVDLPRLRLSRFPNEIISLEKQLTDKLSLAGVDGRIEITQPMSGASPNCVLVKSTDLNNKQIFQFLQSNPTATVFVFGTTGPNEKKAIKKLGFREGSNEPKILMRSQ